MNVTETTCQDRDFLQGTTVNTGPGVGGPVVEASEDASLLFRASRESLCLPSSLDIQVSAKENK